MQKKYLSIDKATDKIEKIRSKTWNYFKTKKTGFFPHFQQIFILQKSHLAGNEKKSFVMKFK
jgi:hypothetical protein